MNDKLSSSALGGLLLTVTLAAYFSAFNGDFHYDDALTILENHHVESLNAFIGHLDHMVRPVLYATFLFDRSLYGMNPLGYHLLNRHGAPQRGDRAVEPGQDAVAGRLRQDDPVRGERRRHPGVEIPADPVERFLAHPDAHLRRTDLIGEQHGPRLDRSAARYAARHHRQQPTPASSGRRPLAGRSGDG